VSGGNGGGNGAGPAKTEPGVTSESQSNSQLIARNLLIAQIAGRTVDKRLKEEEEKFAKDIVPPLILGPQRYTDPEVWGPPKDLRPVIPSGPDAGKKVPPTQDPHYAKVGILLDELDSTVPLPGDD
jgi:hypothetical protein